MDTWWMYNQRSGNIFTINISDFESTKPVQHIFVSQMCLCRNSIYLACRCSWWGCWLSGGHLFTLWSLVRSWFLVWRILAVYPQSWRMYSHRFYCTIPESCPLCLLWWCRSIATVPNHKAPWGSKTRGHRHEPPGPLQRPCAPQTLWWVHTLP